MRSIAILIVALLTLAGVQISRAADLQAGWYATIYSVSYYQYDAYGNALLVGDPSFLTVPGTYGPFLLSDAPYHWQRSRQVDVSVDTPASPSDTLTLPLRLAIDAGTSLAYVGFLWETDYDPEQMRLEFWGQGTSGQERLWWQPLSGARQGYAQVAYDWIVQGPFSFRVVVVPEPSSLFCLLAPLGLAARFVRRSRR